MNSTLATGDGTNDTGTRTIGGFGYILGLSFGSLLIIITVTCAAYACTRTRVATNPTTSHRGSTLDSDDDESVTIQVQGLDEATLLTYPKLLYSQAKLHRDGDSTATGCSICLADYKATDTLRLLPDCGHLFHSKCIDPWLMVHPTCPICRSSPKPSPLSSSNRQVFLSSAGNGHSLVSDTLQT
ncbi:hypothetical protein RJ639_034806 [Escallonia herrerae]|uniref:RING-type E3 ubiquitin transferase n=1 Tax=Escallonia herrerae TaxID=1293975 RepID=A0AA88WW77_9ASTE|nr:hypothetical protein RJ639_034806 [Escallonia herrerae]